MWSLCRAANNGNGKPWRNRQRQTLLLLFYFKLTLQGYITHNYFSLISLQLSQLQWSLWGWLMFTALRSLRSWITAKDELEQVLAQLRFGRSLLDAHATRNAYKGDVYFPSIHGQSTHQNAGALLPIWSCKRTESCPKSWGWSPTRIFPRPSGSSPSSHGPRTGSATEPTPQPRSRCSRRLGLQRLSFWLTPSSQLEPLQWPGTLLALPSKTTNLELLSHKFSRCTLHLKFFIYS